MRRFHFALGVIVALAGLTTAYGQNRLPSGSGFGGSTSAPAYGGSAAGGSQGMFGARNLGSSLSAGNRGFAGGGNRGVGQAGRGGVAGQTLQGDTAGQLTGNERFLRGARQPGQFVGSDTGDLPAGMTQVPTGQGRTNTALNGRNNRGQNQANVNDGNNNNRGGGRGRNGNQPMLRTQRVVGFDYPVPKASAITVEFPQRVAKLPQFRNLGPIQVELQNRTAILRGEVATAHDRDLIERLALLEPGISQVQNEISVAATPAATAPELPQPTAE